MGSHCMHACSENSNQARVVVIQIEPGQTVQLPARGACSTCPMLKLLALCILLMGALGLVAGKVEPCDVAWQDISCELQTKKGLFKL
eukprot:10647-Heterococcus_DN1.PRE.3